MPKLTLEYTAYTLNQIPSLSKAQIALAGRSNVGKSSIINALSNDKKLAKTSATPGKTRSINFYYCLQYDFYLVDLPGYGYAKASHGERKFWAQLLEQYLKNCSNLKAMVLLLDCRRIPQESDLSLITFTNQLNISIIPVLTKADKCNQKEKTQSINAWNTIFGFKPLLTSTIYKLGIQDLWQILEMNSKAI